MKSAESRGFFLFLGKKMQKVAILIDGGFLLKRLPSVCRDIDKKCATSVDKSIGKLVNNHLWNINKIYGQKNHYSLLYRCFFYDAKPYQNKGQFPVSRKPIDYSKSDESKFRLELFDLLRKRPNFAVRLGEVRLERSWILKEDIQKKILSKQINIDNLKDEDFYPGFRQKAVDMKLGLDIATLTLKKQVSTIILVTGDSDFVPAAKVARREGVQIVLDPLWREVNPELFEHIDKLQSGFPRPGSAEDSNQES